MTSPLDILTKLRPLVWRGVAVPCVANSAQFKHTLVPHRQWGVDGSPVENTSRENAVFSFRIPFRVGIDDYPDLYPTKFRDFYNAFLDGSVGTLQHPEFGDVEVKPDSWAMHVDPKARDGYDVDASWVEDTENGLSLRDAGDSPIDHAVSLAGGLETLSGAVNPPVVFDDGSGLSLTGAMNKVKGAILLAETNVQNAIMAIEGTLDALNDMIDAINSITDPKAWGLSDGLKEICRLLTAAQDKLNGTKTKSKINFVTATSSMLVSIAASQYGMSLENFLKLNPRMALSKTIKQGTEFFVEV